MAMTDLDTIAGALKVHPRTILRALAGKVNVYWAEGHNPEVDLAEVALAYGIELNRLRDVLKGKDELLKPDEGAAQISLLEGRKVPLRTFRYRDYPAVIRTKSVVRYSKLEIGAYHVEHIA